MQGEITHVLSPGDPKRNWAVSGLSIEHLFNYLCIMVNVSVITSDPPYKHCIVRFTMVPLKSLSDQ